jgi:Nif-specific regulatory protein
MAATLKALSGPLQGRQFPLLERDCSIGRGKTNTLSLVNDAGVSRLHCVITAEDERFTIRDLDSHNRTYVNAQEVHERHLSHGDEIQIGHSLFVFLVDGQPAPRRVLVDLDEAETLDVTATTLPRGPELARLAAAMQDASAESPGPSKRSAGSHGPSPSSSSERADALPPVMAPAQVARVVQSLVRVCRAVSSSFSLQDLQRSLLQSVMDVIAGVDRAAILLVGDQRDEFASALHWTRSGGEVPSFRIPRGAIQRVLDEGVAVCMNDLRDNPSTRSSTILQSRISSLMAVPIVADTAVRGVLYTDSIDQVVRFGSPDAQLVTILAETAAVPLATALRLERLERDHERLVAELPGNQPLVGHSDRMRTVRRLIAKVAAGDSTVLVLGASGTGKELVARAIHRNSRRSAKPFVAINCAALTESLIESELFGHEKGAFTGAFAQKKGKLEEAQGGTVFLDEIGELVPSLQVKLLRVLQEREFQRVGGTRLVNVDIRVVAATNRNLEQEVRHGTFRQDLFFRLNVVSVVMPELRERREDIPLLARHFLRKHANRCGRRVSGFSDEALACLVAHDWPGNVRELENAIERALVLGTTEQVLPDDLPESVLESATITSSSSPGLKFYQAIREIKRQLVTRALKQSDGSYADAAKQLGLHPNNLHRLMKTLNLKPRA